MACIKCVFPSPTLPYISKGLYVVEFGDLDVDEMRYISKSITDLLVHGEGIDIIIEC